MSTLKVKITAIFFVLMSLFSSMQLVLNQHFCCDRLVSVSFNERKDSCCKPVDCCQLNLEKQSKSCCADKELVLEAFEFLYHLNSEVPEMKILENFGLYRSNAFDMLVLSEQVFVEDSPPPIPKFSQRVYCVLRI